MPLDAPAMNSPCVSAGVYGRVWRRLLHHERVEGRSRIEGSCEEQQHRRSAPARGRCSGMAGTDPGGDAQRRKEAGRPKAAARCATAVAHREQVGSLARRARRRLFHLPDHDRRCPSITPTSTDMVELHKYAELSQNLLGRLRRHGQGNDVQGVVRRLRITATSTSGPIPSDARRTLLGLTLRRQEAPSPSC